MYFVRSSYVAISPDASDTGGSIVVGVGSEDGRWISTGSEVCEPALEVVRMVGKSNIRGEASRESSLSEYVSANSLCCSSA